MYADDHQLHKINENVSTVNHNLNANATKASVWYKSNLLKGLVWGGGYCHIWAVCVCYVLL